MLLPMTAIVLAACSSSTPPPERAARESQAMNDRSFSWSQDDQPSGNHAHPVPLMPTSQGFCFLTGVSGSFRGTGESVILHVVNDEWTLDGTSLQPTGEVHAEAFCVPWTRFAAPEHSVPLPFDGVETVQYAPVTGDPRHLASIATRAYLPDDLWRSLRPTPGDRRGLDEGTHRAQPRGYHAAQLRW
jgi:hypothetical protein